MRTPQRITYQGGPLDGQTALPTAVRGQQFTIFRTADGRTLRTENGDRWSRAENAKRPHPGYYSKQFPTGIDRSTLETTGSFTVLGAYVWTPARAKGDAR